MNAHDKLYMDIKLFFDDYILAVWTDDVKTKAREYLQQIKKNQFKIRPGDNIFIIDMIEYIAK